VSRDKHSPVTVMEYSSRYSAPRDMSFTISVPTPEQFNGVITGAGKGEDTGEV
jgi:hypothetical protein